MTTFLARLPKARPARFERVRIALARHVFRRHLYGYKLCVTLVPRDHPWSVLVRSAYDDVSALTDEALWPRNPATGCPDPDERLKHGKAMWRSFLTTTIIAYLALDAISTRVPGPMSHFHLDDQVRIFERLAEAASAFVGA